MSIQYKVHQRSIHTHYTNKNGMSGLNEEAQIDIKDIEELESKDTYREIQWREEHEKILVEWADKAMCYRWLHSKAHSHYASLNAWFTIPVIIVSTITGTANFAQDRFGDAYKDLAVMVVGGLNLLAGIVGLIQQFLKITQLNEAHRVSSIAWDKFYRNIKIELAKHPEERMGAGQMLKISKEEFDRLMETSPVIPDKIIATFKTTFRQIDEFKRISKPEILDVLVSTESFRYVEKINPTVTRETMINKKHQEVQRHAQKVKDFFNTFKQIHGRDPLADEVMEQFEGVMDNKELTLILNSLERKQAQLQDTDGMSDTAIELTRKTTMMHHEP